MNKKEDMYPDKKKLYIIEYDNGESFEDNWHYTLDVAFESLDNAIDYVRSTYVELDSDDYDDEVVGKIPDRLYYTKEKTNYQGEFVFYLEDDEFEDNCYNHYESGGSYTIQEIRVIG